MGFRSESLEGGGRRELQTIDIDFAKFANCRCKDFATFRFADSVSWLRKESGGEGVNLAPPWKSETLAGFERSSTQDIPDTGRACKNLPDFWRFQRKANVDGLPLAQWGYAPGNSPGPSGSGPNWPTQKRDSTPKWSKRPFRCAGPLRRVGKAAMPLVAVGPRQKASRGYGAGRFGAGSCI